MKNEYLQYAVECGFNLEDVMHCQLCNIVFTGKDRNEFWVAFSGTFAQALDFIKDTLAKDKNTLFDSGAIYEILI